jgi:lysozyme
MAVFGEKKGSLEIPGMNYKQGAPDFPAPGVYQEPVMQTPRVPDALIELVALYESFVSHPYWDATGKVWTIGYGTTRHPTTGEPVRETDPDITREQALAYMRADLASFSAMAEKAIKVDTTDDQFSAFVSILYNVGPGRKRAGKDLGRDGILTLKDGRPSSLLRLLNEGNYHAARAQFPSWNRSGGAVLKGLKRRRLAEQMVWDGFRPQVAYAQATREIA